MYILNIYFKFYEFFIEINLKFVFTYIYILLYTFILSEKQFLINKNR